MERRDTGRLNKAPGHSRLLLWTLGYTLVAFVLLSIHGDAFAAQLVDVRVGEHQGYTRIVLELDSLAAYQVSEPRDSDHPVMKVELDARGEAREFKPSHPIVEAIRIESIGRATAIYVSLEKAEVQINEMILLSPPRLVFDLRDPAAGVVKAAVTPKVIPPSKRRTKPARTASAPPKLPRTLKAASTTQATTPPPDAALSQLGSTASPKPVKRDAALAAAAKPPSTPPQAAAEPLSAPATPPSAGEGAGAVKHAAAEAAPAVTKPAAEAPGRPLALDGAATGRPNSLAMPGSPPALPAASTKAGKLEVPPLPSQRRTATAPSDAAPAGHARVGILAKVRGFVAGINKMVLAGAGVFVALLLFFVVRRGRGGGDALSPVMAADHLGAEGDDLFGGPDAGATEPTPTVRSSASTPQQSPPQAAGGGNLETRVAQLETTLQQLGQARENMERQLAAQTEELRVQRAAIARTQRVVRSFGDTEEDTNGATEPVPRAPAS